MPHVQAHEHATVARVVLLRRVLQVDEAEGLVDQAAEFLGRVVCFGLVAGWEAVVVEGDAVDDADEEEGPVRAAFCGGDALVVVDGEEDVCDVCEVREGVFDCSRVGCLHEHEGHGWSEENDVAVFVVGEIFAFEVSRSVVSDVVLTWPSPRR